MLTAQGALVIDVSQWGWVMMIWDAVLMLVGYGLVSGASWARWAAGTRRRRELGSDPVMSARSLREGLRVTLISWATSGEPFCPSKVALL